MWNVTFQPSQAGEGEGRRAFLEAPSPGAQGDRCIASGCPEPGSSLAFRGLSAGWRFRFLRKLAGPGWQGWSWLPAGQADTEGQGQAAGWQDLPRGESKGARGNRISLPAGRTGPLCGGPSSCADPSRRTIAQCCCPPSQALRFTLRPAEGEETGWRFFIVANIKLGLSPLSLPPTPTPIESR